jgi:hypothetical protein
MAFHQKADYRRQHHQQQADAVDTDQILRSEAGNPIGALHHLVAQSALVKARHQRQRNQEAGEGDQVGPEFDDGLGGGGDE